MECQRIKWIAMRNDKSHKCLSKMYEHIWIAPVTTKKNPNFKSTQIYAIQIKCSKMKRRENLTRHVEREFFFS